MQSGISGISGNSGNSGNSEEMREMDVCPRCGADGEPVDQWGQCLDREGCDTRWRAGGEGA